MENIDIAQEVGTQDVEHDVLSVGLIALRIAFAVCSFAAFADTAAPIVMLIWGVLWSVRLGEETLMGVQRERSFWMEMCRRASWAFWLLMALS